MSLRRTRAIAYGVVAVLGVAAILLTKPLPTAELKPGAVLSNPQGPRWRERHDTLAKGDNLFSVLARGGVSEIIAREAFKSTKVLDFRRIPAGLPITVRSQDADTLPSEIILRLAVDRLLHLRRTDSGWASEEQRLPWIVDTVVVNGRIRTNLYAAMDAAASGFLTPRARYRLVEWIADDIFEYRVDMSRDLQVGDEFQVIAQRRTAPDGSMRIDTVIAASMKLSGKTIEAVRFYSAKTGAHWFDQDGRPMRSGFLRSPLQFTRITSRFGMRRHPVLGTMRQHQGVDYGAASGTPIRAVGDGVVIRANYHGGYGNVVEIRHANGYVTRYGHMRGFAQGIRAGARVSQRQTIGYVGSTGMSTGPHLHFEVLVRGVHRNPALALAGHASEPLPASERAAFAATRNQVLAMLHSPRYLAAADVRQAGAPSGAQ